MFLAGFFFKLVAANGYRTIDISAFHFCRRNSLSVVFFVFTPVAEIPSRVYFIFIAYLLGVFGGRFFGRTVYTASRAETHKVANVF